MAYLNWKQNLGEGGITPEKGKKLLKNFRYPTEIDKNGNLLIDVGLSKAVVSFKENGPDSTLIGYNRSKFNPIGLSLLILSILLFVIPGLIFQLINYKKTKKVYFEAVKLMNQKIEHLNQPTGIEAYEMAPA
jgi:hypothetical protein